MKLPARITMMKSICDDIPLGRDTALGALVMGRQCTMGEYSHPAMVSFSPSIAHQCGGVPSTGGAHYMGVQHACCWRMHKWYISILEVLGPGQVLDRSWANCTIFIYGTSSICHTHKARITSMTTQSYG